MRFVETSLPGAYVVEIEPHLDERGFFARTYCDDEFVARGLPVRWPQCNLSRNARAGTLRGLHYNAPPFQEAKLVRCVAGAIWDVIVDLRPDSPTRFGWFGVELSQQEGNALFVPEGLAHGFISLRDGSDVYYHMGRSFQPGAGRGVRWDDPRIAIRWPRAPVVISASDRGYPDIDAAAAP